jgi:hypothetical protein
MNEELSTLIEEARNWPFPAEDREAQRRSFAHGNTKIANDLITREMIVEADERSRPNSQRPGSASFKGKFCCSRLRFAGLLSLRRLAPLDFGRCVPQSGTPLRPAAARLRPAERDAAVYGTAQAVSLSKTKSRQK